MLPGKKTSHEFINERQKISHDFLMKIKSIKKYLNKVIQEDLILM